MAAGGFDYVVVGAGSAGSVLANRLSAYGACRVAVLEAGGPDRAREIRIPVVFTKLLQTAYDWNYRTTRQLQLSGRKLYWPRARLWAVRPRFTGRRGPEGTALTTTAGRKAVLAGPMRRYCRTSSGPSTGSAATPVGCTARRVRSSSPNCATRTRPHWLSWPLRRVGYAPSRGAERAGQHWDSPTRSPSAAGCGTAPRTPTYAPLGGDRTCQSSPGAHVQRILFDGARAIGVEYSDAAGVTQRVTVSGEVILSGGAVNSPQLLMLSRLGRGHDLEEARLGIGQRRHNHDHNSDHAGQSSTRADATLVD